MVVGYIPFIFRVLCVKFLSEATLPCKCVNSVDNFCWSKVMFSGQKSLLHYLWKQHILGSYLGALPILGSRQGIKISPGDLTFSAIQIQWIFIVGWIKKTFNALHCPNDYETPVTILKNEAYTIEIFSDSSSSLPNADLNKVLMNDIPQFLNIWVFIEKVMRC